MCIDGAKPCRCLIICFPKKCGVALDCSETGPFVYYFMGMKEKNKRDKTSVHEMKMSFLMFIGVEDQETLLFLVGITDSCPCCLSICKSVGIFY